MNAVKKSIGLLLLVLAPALVSLMTWQAIDKIGKSAEGAARNNVILQWGIILIIFIPISIGLILFGWYALKGEYSDRADEGESENG